MLTDEEITEKVRSIFFPDYPIAMRRVADNGLRFVYYTDAETASNILINKEIWMRNSSTMNDYMEIEHGFECLNQAYKQVDLKDKFTKLTDGCFGGLVKETEDKFNAWLPTIRTDTYITSVSEHLPEEDDHGRLSMWRAYGGRAGIAIVINGDVLVSESNVLGAFSFPISYKNAEDVRAQFSQVVHNIEQSLDFLLGVGRQRVANVLFELLHLMVLGTKHPGFHEEREWRVFNSPKIYGDGLLKSAVAVVRGIPQNIKKIPLNLDYPDEGLVGLSLPKLISRIIIGPTEYPVVMRKAFVTLLGDAGVEHPEDKVYVSQIPLRNVG